MNIPQRHPPRMPERAPDILEIMYRMERAVRQYRWLTYANVIVWGCNCAMLSAYLVARYLFRI